eukprot:3277670-Rhodomonas_salina.1
MGHAYESIYRKQKAAFVLTTAPKLDMQSIDDLEKAVRSGAVTMDMLGDVAQTLGSDFLTGRYHPLPHYLNPPGILACAARMTRPFDAQMNAATLRLNFGFAAAETNRKTREAVSCPQQQP